METYNFNQEERLVQAQKRVKSIKGFYTHATVFLFVNTFIIISCSINDPANLFTADPYMTSLFWVIGLAAHGFSVFGQDIFFGRNWEEKKIQKILNK